MGIQGLLPMLKSVIRDDHISSLKGRRLAVDTYAWLHKAAYSCASDLCEGRTTTKWVSYILYMVDMLLEFNIEVTLVFDGKELPAKMGTEKERASNRALNLAKAREYTKAGESDKAFNCYTQAVDISPRMAAELIAVIRQHRPNVKIVVAPYEADAQLAFLCSANLVDGVVSEDSDTVPYGCSSVVYKLQKTGKCQVLHRTDLYSVDIPSFDMRAFTPAMTISMCIVAGCDYLSNAKGVGIKKAYELVSRQKEPARILRKMRLENLLPLLFVSAQPTFSVSAAAAQQAVKSLLIYDVEFYKAHLTFNHQTVFDPTRRCSAPLSPINPATIPESFAALGLADMTFAGPALPNNELACAIADGLVDPCTYEPFNLPQQLERPLETRENKPSRNSSDFLGGSGGGSGAGSGRASTGQRDLMQSFFASKDAGVVPRASSNTMVPKTSQRRPLQPLQHQNQNQNQQHQQHQQQQQLQLQLQLLQQQPEKYQQQQQQQEQQQLPPPPPPQAPLVRSSFFSGTKSVPTVPNTRPILSQSKSKGKPTDPMVLLQNLHRFKSEQFWEEVGPMSQSKTTTEGPTSIYSDSAAEEVAGYDSDLAPPEVPDPFSLDSFALKTSPVEKKKKLKSPGGISKSHSCHNALVLQSPGQEGDDYDDSLANILKSHPSGHKRSRSREVAPSSKSLKGNKKSNINNKGVTSSEKTGVGGGFSFDSFRFVDK